ncbi:MAG: Gfo/Idh/MocA family oxidoreductase [Chloroflexota bacterium]|nr:Gfo/Idh/MocA family oxidoreductase [Chloroflexota bacterium]
MRISMPDPGALRFGIVGCGNASVPVCEAIAASPSAELTAVFDVNQDLAKDIHQRFHVPTMGTLAELLASEQVDAVYIAVPHYLLAALTQEVLRAGKHALAEKPLALSLRDADRLIHLADEQQVALGVFYEMRYASAHPLAREFIQAGMIGRIIGVQMQTLIDKPTTYWQSGYGGRSLNPWRSLKNQAGGGVVIMNTSHLLDALFYITGLAVVSVSADMGTLVADVEVEDTASATFRFNNGALGSLMAGAHIKGAQNDEYFRVFGTEGQIHLPDPYGSDPLRIYLKRPWREFQRGQWYSISTERVSVYRRAIEDYAVAVQSGGCAPVDGHAARRVLAVVMAIYQSASEKRTITIS